MKQGITLAYCPTRRDVFSREEAVRFNGIIREQMSGFTAKIVDLDGINEEKLLFNEQDLEPVINRFRCENVDAIFFPHCNFGSENLVARVAKELNVPVLLWGPRDDAPDAAGFRSRDSQCGLFATGKLLRRHNVPFTYLTNSWVNSEDFKNGFERFLASVNVVKAMRRLNILQISTRPDAFGSVICNENELLERFNIHITPITLTDLVLKMDAVIAENSAEYRQTCDFIRSLCNGSKDSDIQKSAALKIAMRILAKENNCSAVAIQCWNSLQTLTGIMPCLSNALLTDEGIPVVCETDIHGAITAVMTQAVAFENEPQFFADITIRHPENDNAELLWHCGNFPYSLAKNKSEASFGHNPYNADKCFGICEWELKEGDLTIARFDGDHGQYSLFIGEAHTTSGPKNVGSYVWIEVENWPRWEHKLVEGPYIHHVSCIYGKRGEILLEACKYIPGLTPDVVEPSVEALLTRWY